MHVNSGKIHVRSCAQNKATSVPGQTGLRPRMSRPLTTRAINSDQEPRNRLPPSMWCMGGVRRSRCPSLVGRHGRVAVSLAHGLSGYGTAKMYTTAVSLPATRRRFERPVAPRDKPGKPGRERSPGVTIQANCVT